MRCPTCNYHEMFDDDERPSEYFWCARCGTFMDDSGFAVPELTQAFSEESAKADLTFEEFVVTLRQRLTDLFCELRETVLGRK